MPPDLPDGLHDLWRASVPEGLPPGRFELVLQAFRCLHRLRQVQEQIGRDGLVLRSERSGLARRHPLLGDEATLRRQFTKLWEASGLARSRQDIRLDALIDPDA